ncbi:MAG: DEAD/DEAH box helicase [Planctomycetaceae bacterium]|nr:DEAD/DEAH box helicase [Planctomycetales bacterium]MCB9927624.1 DEAD/DEAH box helicase [Planctomycetaceae bacterium]
MSPSEIEVPSEELNVELQSVETEASETSPENGFRPLGLSENLLATVERSGYSEPTPIQAQTIPLLLQGRDVLGQAQTGTGKTAAFALPLLDRIDLFKKQTQVLVLAPTRELAIQVAEAFEKYAGKMRGLRVVPIYGGQDYQLQFRQLDRGVHVVVGTPGRVMDHMRRGSLNLDDLQCLVLDEADEMLRMGFADDVEWVLTQAPAKRQMALFSATMPRPIRQIAQKHLKDPVEITIAQKTATADTINQRYIVASPHQKQAALARILEAEPTDGVLVFVKTRATTEPLAEFLAQNGLKTAALNGDIAQKQREKIVDGLKAGKVDVIVATDVAARGLDVQRISHVINYDLPFDSEAYIHRIGRTGRAGRSGEAILFVHPRERRLLKRLEQATRQSIEPMDLPSNRTINKQRVARFHERITQGLAHKEIDTFLAIVDHYQREHPDVALEQIAASLALLANEETPLLVKDELKQATFGTDSHPESGDSRTGAKKRDFQSDRRGGSRRCDAGMQTFRIEVGRNHQVQPGNIVGAIANEAGVSSESIGKIKIFDHFSTIDLPDTLPRHLLDAIDSIVIGGRKLRLSRMEESRPRPARLQEGKRPFNKPKGKPKFRKKQSSDR